MADEPAKTMTTYRRLDGEEIGDYAWVGSPEFFDDYDEPVEVVEEVWGLIRTETLRLPEHAVELERQLLQELADEEEERLAGRPN